MAYLYKHTDLQDNFSYNMTCLVPDAQDGIGASAMRLGLKEILRYFLDFRLATVRSASSTSWSSSAAAHPHPRRLPDHLQRPGQGDQA